MPLEQAFRLGSVLLAATAVSGLIMARSIPGWLAVVTIIILLLAGFEAIGLTFRLKIPAAWLESALLLNCVLVGALVLALVDAVVISQDLLHAGIHFLVVLLCIKLLTLRHHRDYRHLYAICLMAILASATITTEIWFLPVFLLYLFSTTWTLLLYHLTAGINGPMPLRKAQADPVTHLHLNSRFVWFTNGIVLTAFALTIVIFFAIPRINAGILQKSRGEGLKTTGFSERVDLGMIGSVKEDPQVVMRVELPDPSTRSRDRLYLRGVAFDHYNGRSWSGSARYRRNLPLVEDGTYAVRTGGRRMPEQTTQPLRQDILLEALDTSVLFAAPFADLISGELMGVQADNMAGFHLPFPPSTRVRYSVISRERQVFEEEQRAPTPTYSDAILTQYLQLPIMSPQVMELAQRVTAGANSSYEQMRAVHRHLSTDYAYSLDIESTTSARPIEDFLFIRKTGYCEHYATAMVIMLRSLGIPSRLVTGFLASEWNDFGNYYTVRQRDAHAWVEVYYPHSGWVTVDPTPASATVASGSQWQVLHRIGESIRLQWDRFFIRFSGRDQLAVVYRLRDGGDSVRQKFNTWASILTVAASPLLTGIDIQDHWGGSLVFGLFLIVLSTGIFLVIKLIPRWRPATFSGNRGSGHTQHQIIHLYKKMIGIASRRGIVMRPSTTPLEFVRIVSANWKSGEPIVANVTALYCRGRFGGTPLSREELAQAREQITALQNLSRAMR